VALRVSKDGFSNLVAQFPRVGVEVMHELASQPVPAWRRSGHTEGS
jgi:hypothetical protein